MQRTSQISDGCFYYYGSSAFLLHSSSVFSNKVCSSVFTSLSGLFENHLPIVFQCATEKNSVGILGYLHFHRKPKNDLIEMNEYSYQASVKRMDNRCFPRRENHSDN